MKRRIAPPEPTIVGYSTPNLTKAVEMLLSMSAACPQFAGSDMGRESSLAQLAVPEAALIREQLLCRAEQPFVEEWDHVIHGRIYGRRDERFGVVYEALPCESDESIETRDGRPASVLARFWIHP